MKWAKLGFIYNRIDIELLCIHAKPPACEFFIHKNNEAKVFLCPKLMSSIFIPLK